MYMKKLFIAVFTSLLVQTAFAQDSLTVDQAVQRVLQTHPALGQAMANVRSAEARHAQSQSAQYPDVSALAQYTRIGPLPEFNFGASIPLAPSDNYDGHVGALYTVYDFGKTNSSINVAQSRVQSMRDAVELTRTGLALQTIRTFFSLVLLQKSLIVQNEQIDALNQHLSLTQKRVDAGTATNFDVLTTQVRVASAQNQKVDIENSIQKQTSVLRELLGLPAGSKINVRGILFQERRSLNTDSLLQLANERRTELKLARDAEQSALLQQRLSELGNAPSLKIGATYGFKNGYEPNLDAWRGNWAAFATAQISLFDGNRTKHQVEESQAALEAERASTDNVTKQIRAEVEQSIADVQAAETKVEISKVQLQQAHDAVTMARTRYEVGTITNLDLLDAETAESSSKLTDLQATYQYVISNYQLQKAAGTLLSK
jgi:outer membrane protein TolC